MAYLTLMLVLLENEILEDNMFSLLVFGTLLTMIISSVKLKRKLKKVVHVKVGTSELSLMPVYFRSVVSDLTAKNVLQTEYLKINPDYTIEQFQNENKISKKTVFVVLDDEKNIVGLVSKNK